MTLELLQIINYCIYVQYMIRFIPRQCSGKQSKKQRELIRISTTVLQTTFVCGQISTACQASPPIPAVAPRSGRPTCTWLP